MLTLQELKQITGRPEQIDKTPSAKYLERHDTVVAVRRLDTNTKITVYKSGYALYRVCSRATVFSLFQCRKYLYESENEEISIGESFFDKQPWYVRLILEGEDRLNRNREVLEHKNCISYSAVSEEWFVLVDKMKCPLEQIVLEETIKELSGREIPCSELRFALGITGADALKKLEIKDTSYAIELWVKKMGNYTNTVKVFDGIIELLKNLRSLDYEMGIVTSKTREEFTNDFCPFWISHNFKTIICADDTQEHKPNAAPILKYVELSKADCSKVLYIGDSKYDSKCAENAGIDFALAVWGSHNKHIKADYFLERPADLLSAITSIKSDQQVNLQSEFPGDRECCV